MQCPRHLQTPLWGAFVRFVMLGASTLALVSGCATTTEEQRSRALSQGRFEVLQATAGVIVAAPHADTDDHTGDIVKAMLERTRLSGVIAWGFPYGTALRDRYNVNRPTEEGGVRCSQERETARARAVYEAYRQQVVLAAQATPRLYIEVHGNSMQPDIEVATVRVTKDEAARLKEAYLRIRDKYVLARPGYPRFDFLIEPLDRIRMVASCTKEKGIFRDMGKVLHIELPRAARTELHRDTLVAILAELIDVAATFLAGRQ